MIIICYNISEEKEVDSMKRNSRIVVTSKWSYLLLLSIPFGILKMIFDYQNVFSVANPNVIQFVYDTFISVLIITIGVIMFIKLNTHSNWMNPDHPKSKEEYSR